MPGGLRQSRDVIFYYGVNVDTHVQKALKVFHFTLLQHWAIIGVIKKQNMNFESPNFGGEINKQEETPEAYAEKIKKYAAFVLAVEEVDDTDNGESEEVKRIAVLNEFVNQGVIPIELRDEVEHEIVEQIKEKSQGDESVENELDEAA